MLLEDPGTCHTHIKSAAFSARRNSVDPNKMPISGARIGPHLSHLKAIVDLRRTKAQLQEKIGGPSWTRGQNHT